MNASAWRKFRSDPWGMTALVVVLCFVLTAVGVEIYGAWCHARGVIPLYLRSDPAMCYAPPSPRHPCGTDYQGRDVLSRTVAGTASALKVGVVSGLIAAAVGVSLGILAGYFGGRTDEITVWLYSTFAAMPTLLFILAFALLFSPDFLSPAVGSGLNVLSGLLRVEPGMLGVYLAIGLTGWVTLCRVVRGETMKLKSAGFVVAAKVAGVGHAAIMIRHILPNVFHLVIIYFTTLFAGAVMLEVIVSYLGLGAQTAPSWGMMIADGQTRLWSGVWWEITAASTALLILVLALNLLGDALRDALDPRR
ncbi:MAG: ABC transporter permease [Lentisphaeria bacterium]|nr:ABC transporter permease [Lentisphaeria bacterium]